MAREVKYYSEATISGNFSFNNCTFKSQQKTNIMKKLVFISIAALFMAVSANAQIFSYGLKAGVNFSQLGMDDLTGITGTSQAYDLVTGESARGYQAGLMTRIKIAMVFVQPEVYFNTTGGTVEQVVSGEVTDVMDVKFSRFDIPLLVGVKFGPARINAGPVGSAVINSVNELDNVPELQTVSDGLDALSSQFTWGFQAGIGIDLFKKLALDARYEGSLSKYGEAFTVDGTDYNLDARPSQWILTLGWWF